uniref:FtsJ-like methyltransferase n=1 Tax=Pithovirus LCPAC302 TaxID=2506593 RepID=A0A481Z8V4_9VIRU|nr:MAG: FtsJ-like methyltransferase [Pithovirus LCPAC302]
MGTGQDIFENVSVKPFRYRDSIVLADIDSVFNFSHHTSGYIMKQETKDFTFATIDDGPGKFTEYILYRNPNSYGFGIAQIEHPFDTDIIDVTHFNITKGESGFGDINRDYKSFIKYVRSTEVSGVDLVAANYNYNETKKGFVARLLTALGTVKIGGTFICKISNIKDPIMIQLLYITSECFSKVTLFKPVSTPMFSNLYLNSYYIIAEGANKNNIEWISYLGKYVDRLDEMKIEVDNNFVNWIQDYLVLMADYVNFISENEIDTYKCKAIWNLPQL